MPARFLFAVLLAASFLTGCRTAEQAADATVDAAASVGDAVVDGVRIAADATADVASAAYDGARDVVGADRVPENARVAVARIMAPSDTTTGVTGTVTFVELTDGVYMSYDLRGLSAGDHGIHVHANGSCGRGPRGMAGGAAGDHFNPGSRPHGEQDHDADERHAGDLGNIRAGSDGHARGDKTDDVLSFDGMTALVGHALIVHAQRDDETSQPSGNAGGRVGCGVIQMSERRR